MLLSAQLYNMIMSQRRPEFNAPTGRLNRKQPMCNISSPFDDKDDNVADNEINKQLH
jgi:hypothetical protein